MSSLSLRAVQGAALAAILALAGPAAAAELLGRAVLPAATFAPGPTSGQFTGGGNGFTTPFTGKQPVQGFSAVLPGPRKGTLLVMVDNGFGAKANSADALLRLYAVKPDWATGQVFPVDRRTGAELPAFGPESFITLRDPDRRMPFTIVADRDVYPGTSTSGSSIPVDPAIKAGRLLTGADLDIESVRRGADGTLWFGDEFGPYLVHTDPNGRVLEAPIPLPNLRRFPNVLGGAAVNPFVQAPSNPQLSSPADANIPDSGGFEGMAVNRAGTRLYPLLEKALNGDPLRTRRLIQEFSIRTRAYTGETWGYLTEGPTYSIGDMTPLSDRTFLVIERDQGTGDASDPRFTNPARWKRIFKVDLDRADADGNLVKEEIVDLMKLYDPRDVVGDGRIENVLTFPFVTIEDLLVLDDETLLVINDNNFPFSSGRTFGVADDDEFVLLHVAPLGHDGECHHDDDRDEGRDHR